MFGGDLENSLFEDEFSKKTSITKTKTVTFKRKCIIRWKITVLNLIIEQYSYFICLDCGIPCEWDYDVNQSVQKWESLPSRWP
jgi:hypothetical protein